MIRPLLFIVMLMGSLMGYAQSERSNELFAKGVELYKAAKYREAIPVFEQMQQLDEAELDSASTRRDYGKEWMASCYFRLGQTARAAEINPWGFDITPMDRRLAIDLDSLQQRAIVLASSDAKAAAKLYQERAELYRERYGETATYAVMLINVLSTWYSANEFGMYYFRDMLVKAKGILETNGTTHGLFYCYILDLWAQQMKREGLYQDAINTNLQEIGLLPQQPIWMHYNAWYRLCELYCLTKDAQQLCSSWKQLQDVTEQLYTLNNYGYANVLSDVSMYFYNLGRFPEALELKDKLIPLYLQLNDSWNADYQCVARSMVLRDMNRQGDAQKQLDEVLERHGSLVNRDDTTFTMMASAVKTTIVSDTINEERFLWQKVVAVLSEKANIYSLYYLLQHEGPVYSVDILRRASQGQHDENRLVNLIQQMLTFSTSMGARQYREAANQLRIVCDDYAREVADYSPADLGIVRQILSRFQKANEEVGSSLHLYFLSDSLRYQNERALTIVNEMQFYTAEHLYGVESDRCWGAFYDFRMGCQFTSDNLRLRNVCLKYLERMKNGRKDYATENYDRVLQALHASSQALRLSDNELNGILREMYRVEQRLYGNDVSKYYYEVTNHLHELGDMEAILAGDASAGTLQQMADNYREAGDYAKAIEIYKQVFGLVYWPALNMTKAGSDGSGDNVAFWLASAMKTADVSQDVIEQTFDSLLLANRNHPDYLLMVANTINQAKIGLETLGLVRLANNVIRRDAGLWSKHSELVGIILMGAVTSHRTFYAHKRDMDYIEMLVSQAHQLINFVAQQHGEGSINYENFLIYATAMLMGWNTWDVDNQILPADIPDLVEKSIQVHEHHENIAFNTYRSLLFWQMRLKYDAGKDDEAVMLGERINRLPEKLENNPISDNTYIYPNHFILNDDSIMSQTARLLSQCYQRQGKTDLAEQQLLEDLRLDLDKVRHSMTDGWYYSRQSLADRATQLVEKTGGYVLKHHTPAFCGFAYDAALFTKGLLLRSQAEMERTILQSGNESLKNLCITLQDVRKQLSGQLPEGKRDSLRMEEERIEGLLVNSIHYFGDYTRLLTASWKDVRESLHAGQVAIEFVQAVSPDDGKRHYIALILRKGSEPQYIDLCREGDLTSETAQQRLYELVWQPLERQLEGVQTIFFSPAGTLHLLPVESLLRPDGVAMSDLYQMYRLSNTRELIRKKSPEQTLQVALFGGVEYELSSEQWENMSETSVASAGVKATRDAISLERGASAFLPGTEMEVADIEEQLHEKNIRTALYTGIDASEGTVKQLSGTPTTIIHIATHGFFQQKGTGDNPDYSNDKESEEDQAMSRSGLLMAGAISYLRGAKIPDNVDDGILTARELSHLDLTQTSLIVLSACETGLGDITSDGVFGLQRGFKKAGAQSILMSLWKVDDEATCLLMTEFYKHWIGEKKTKHEALQLAMKTVRSHKEKGWDDPKYWAAFILLDGLD